jgi:hypothetical protein
VGSSNSVGRWGRPTTVRRTPDRTRIIWGMCLITDFRTAGHRKFIFGGQEGETDYCTAHAGSDPNYLGKASMEGNAVVRCEFGHVGDGRRADSSTRFPGASSFFYSCPCLLQSVAWADKRTHRRPD